MTALLLGGGQAARRGGLGRRGHGTRNVGCQSAAVARPEPSERAAGAHGGRGGRDGHGGVCFRGVLQLRPRQPELSVPQAQARRRHRALLPLPSIRTASLSLLVC